MSAQEFAQAGVIFIGGITGINILITFVQLCIEEVKKSSIMEKEAEKEEKKAELSFWPVKTKKKYAVLKSVG